MWRKHRLLLIRFTPIPMCLFGLAVKAAAQVDSLPEEGATLRGWEEQRWLTILDRGGAYYGRLSERGILQRFNGAMDSEYRLDLISSSPSLTETYTWYTHDSGARLWAGSVDHIRLALQGEFKARLSLGAGWSADARFYLRDDLNAQRALALLGLRKSLFGGRGQAFVRGTLNAIKPEIDLELGYSLLPSIGDITLAIGALDLFSDFIYQGLEPGPEETDTLLDYSTHPFTFRTALDIQIARAWRLEGYGLVLTPTRITAESQTDPEAGFVQDERYAYAGGLLEWQPSKRTVFGGFGTWVQARVDRAALPAGRPEDDFDLTERTTELGLYGIHHPLGRLSTELWLARVRRTEDRVRPDTLAAENVAYEDRAWAGRADLRYTAASGLEASLGVDFLAQDIIRGRGRVPGKPQDRDHGRLRLDLAWRFDSRAHLLAGVNWDLDGDKRGRLTFDGAHGRFALYF